MKFDPSSVRIRVSSDAEGRRIRQTDGPPTTTYLHDPHGPLSRLLRKTSDGVVTDYVYAGGQVRSPAGPRGNPVVGVRTSSHLLNKRVDQIFHKPIHESDLSVIDK